jgi:hypothetical protein
LFYDDLSPYTYLTDASGDGDGDEDVFGDLTDGVRFVRRRPVYRRLNVGRLDGNRPWPAGPVPDAFGPRPAAIVDAQRVNVMLGLHECDLCPEPRDCGWAPAAPKPSAAPPSAA